MTAYPSEQRQGGMYAVQYLRWVVESGQVNEIGPAAFTLLSVVVMREDSLHYQRAPNFWQSQLMAATGLKSKATLATATQRLVDAGLMVYEPGDRGRPGVYYTAGFGSKIEPQIDGMGESVQKLNRKSAEPVPNGPESVQKLNRKSAPPNPNPLLPIPRKGAARFAPPSLDEVRSFCLEHSLGADPAMFWNYYQSNGWQVGRSKMRDWRAALRNWARRDFGGRAAAPPPERRKMDTRRELV